MKIQNICIISQRYPCPETPSVHVFVQKLVWAMADSGLSMTVISPVPSNSKKERTIKEQTEEVTDKGSHIQVYRPRYFSLGQKLTFPVHTARISENGFYNACRKVIDDKHLTFDAFYGHFICLAGIAAARLGRYYHRPSYFAFGESTDWSYRHYGIEAVRKELAEITGVVSVSTENKNVLTRNSIVPAEKIGVFVNGVNTTRFYPRDKAEARKHFHLPEDAFIASFVGQFVERKGVLRASEAVKNAGCCGIFAGAGDQKPEGDHVLLAQRMNPEDIPWLLSASDLFVFPSTNEGCSNAILEAMACGIPIIAHDGPFNYDILDASNAILLDGTDTQAITEAIKSLMKDPERRKAMSAASLAKVESLSIEQRAVNIHNFMEEKAG